MKLKTPPTLSLIAGPNGSGKTYFSNYLIELGFIKTKPINLDFIDVDVYEKLTGNVYNHDQQISKVKHQLFINSCKSAISNREDFTYECNLRMSQIKPVALFDEASYNLNLFFFYMPNITRCKERVKIRVENKGHNVDDTSIKYNFEKSLQNLDASFYDWNQLIIFDNSIDFVDEKAELGINILLIANNGEILYCSENFPQTPIKGYLKKISIECAKWKDEKKLE